MTIRKITLASAALAAMTLCALPASAASGYTQYSTPEERAQTEALNADAADRARGDDASDAAARDNYNVRNADYRDGMADHAARQQAYDRDMARYNNRYRHHNRYYGPNAVIGFDFGSVAIGYNDGYWDNGHRWHAWRNNSDASLYRARYRNNFHNWRHDRDGNDGWRGDDSWRGR